MGGVLPSSRCLPCGYGADPVSRRCKGRRARDTMHRAHEAASSYPRQDSVPRLRRTDGPALPPRQQCHRILARAEVMCQHGMSNEGSPIGPAMPWLRVAIRSYAALLRTMGRSEAESSVALDALGGPYGMSYGQLARLLEDLSSHRGVLSPGRLIRPNYSPGALSSPQSPATPRYLICSLDELV